jgi:hypothetical protein
LSGIAGLFNESETWSLKLTAIAALVPELTALALLTIRKTDEQFGIDFYHQFKMILLKLRIF